MKGSLFISAGEYGPIIAIAICRAMLKSINLVLFNMLCLYSQMWAHSTHFIVSVYKFWHFIVPSSNIITYFGVGYHQQTKSSWNPTDWNQKHNIFVLLVCTSNSVGAIICQISCNLTITIRKKARWRWRHVYDSWKEMNHAIRNKENPKTTTAAIKKIQPSKHIIYCACSTHSRTLSIIHTFHWIPPIHGASYIGNNPNYLISAHMPTNV